MSDGMTLTNNGKVARLAKTLLFGILCDYAGTTTATIGTLLIDYRCILKVLGLSEQDGGERVHWIVDLEVRRRMR